MSMQQMAGEVRAALEDIREQRDQINAAREAIKANQTRIIDAVGDDAPQEVQEGIQMLMGAYGSFGEGSSVVSVAADQIQEWIVSIGY